MSELVAAVATEIRRMGWHGRRPLDTLYVGGGTPSLLPHSALEHILAAVDARFDRSAEAEVTLEANPEDVDAGTARSWARAGVTRVSVGVQSLDDDVLRQLGRRHSAARAVAAVQQLEDAGVAVSLDLMLGLPGAAGPALAGTLAGVLELRPEHVSVYLLETDKPSALAQLSQRRPDLFPDSDEAANQYLLVGRTLTEAGYRHYELSNFALPGREARHNTRYWRREAVLAAGPAAHGHARRRRWANVDDLDRYVAAVAAAESPRAWSRRLDAGEEVRETVMLGARLRRGVGGRCTRRARELSPAFAAALDDFLALGLARPVGAGFRLTPRGWLVSNELLATLW